ncbi:hypothetical protein CLV42_104273 [Chitinophaga ginsengisoli]|uniref:Uncharacterized protein n=2 Tax=Chitinophaga ginsengisoli TaxID=363837 RepID=A0A2P8GDD8_9BACT|nr:hypothetical protein CLV42_104273 [Chitinophaga ginsengisoli]
MLNKLFPPTICETLYCPYCENINLISHYESRNSFNIKSAPLCPSCGHVTGEYCRCDNCRQYARLRAERKKDKQRSLILEKCSSIFIPPHEVQELSFEASVYLMALTRHSISEDFRFLFLFDKTQVKLAPTFDFIKQMQVSLKECGLISVSPESKIDCFTFNEEVTAITAYYPSEVQWELLPSFSAQEKKAYIAKLQEMIVSGNWPEHWQTECKVLWRALVLDECIEYLIYLLESRHFKEIEVGEKTKAAFDALLEEFSIAQIFNLSWQSVRDMVDSLTVKGIPHFQAVNVFTGTLLRKADRALAQGWIVKDARRDFNCPQSVVSSTLFNLFLKLGDSAWTTKVPGG